MNDDYSTYSTTQLTSKINVFAFLKNWNVFWTQTSQFTIGFQSLNLCLYLCALLFGGWEESDQNCRDERICVPLSTAHTHASETRIHTSKTDSTKTLAVSDLSLFPIDIWVFWPHILLIPDILAPNIKYTIY